MRKPKYRNNYKAGNENPKICIREDQNRLS